jgi:hypothetical protein
MMSAADATEQPIISQFYTRDQSENDNRGPSLTKIHQEQQKLNRERSLITALCKEMNEFTGNSVKRNRKSKPFLTITKETCAIALERYDWDLNEAKSVLERFQKHEEGNDGRNRKSSTKNKWRKNDDDDDDDDEEDESSSSESSDDSSRRRKKRKRKEQKKRESRKKKEKKKKERRNDDDDNDDDNDDDAKEFAFGADEEARKRELEDERKRIKDEQQKALLNKMKISGDLKNYKEQQMLREELIYAQNTGDFAKAEKLKKRLEEVDKAGDKDNYGFRPTYR